MDSEKNRGGQALLEPAFWQWNTECFQAQWAWPLRGGSGGGSVPPGAICLSRTGLVAHDGVDDTVEPPRHDRDGDAMVLVLGPLLPVELAQFRAVSSRAFYGESKDALEAVCFHLGDGLAARLELARSTYVGVRSRVLEDGGHS